MLAIMEETVRLELVGDGFITNNKDEQLLVISDLRVSKTLSKSKSSQEDVQKDVTTIMEK